MKKPRDRKTETRYSKDRKLRHKFRVQKNCLFHIWLQENCQKEARKKGGKRTERLPGGKKTRQIAAQRRRKTRREKHLGRKKTKNLCCLWENV